MSCFQSDSAEWPGNKYSGGSRWPATGYLPECPCVVEMRARRTHEGRRPPENSDLGVSRVRQVILSAVSKSALPLTCVSRSDSHVREAR